MDWITRFVRDTEEIPSPRIFRLWGGIAAVAGALERRCFIRNKAGILFPNLYIILIGPPASGKTQVITRVRDIWARNESLNLTPDNTNRASLIQFMMRQKKMVEVGGKMQFETPVLSPLREFGVLFPEYDTAFMSILTDLYDNPEVYSEERVQAGVRLIERPLLNIIAGSQPDFLQTFLPEAAWGMGLTSRLLFVYYPGVIRTQLFDLSEDDTNAYAHQSTALIRLSGDLQGILDMRGQFRWTQAARVAVQEWDQENFAPAPTHEKLVSYCSRRPATWLKLSSISAASRGSMSVIIEDLERARDWMLYNEKNMADIFEHVTRKTDSSIIDDMATAMWSLSNNTGERTVTELDVQRYFKEREKAERIPKLINLAVSAGVLERTLFGYKVNLSATKRGPPIA